MEIPISPMVNTRYPSLAFSSAISMPVSMERIASRRVMAGPWAIFFVPQAIFRSRRFGTPLMSALIPMSTTTMSERA